MTDKTTASADPKPVAASTASPKVIEGVTLIRLPMKEGVPSHPAARFNGATPNPGDVLEFTLANGVTYRGKVSEAIDVKGDVMAEFADPLIVVSKK